MKLFADFNVVKSGNFSSYLCLICDGYYTEIDKHIESVHHLYDIDKILTYMNQPPQRMDWVQKQRVLR